MDDISVAVHDLDEHLVLLGGGDEEQAGLDLVVPTPEDDDGVMALRFGASARVDLAAALSCDDRPGDVW